MVEQERVLVMVYSAGHQYHHTVSWNDTNVAFERIIDSYGHKHFIKYFCQELDVEL